MTNFKPSRVFAIVTLLALVTGVRAGALHAPTPTSPSSAAAVTIDNFKFGPSLLEITAGTTVTWTNRDDVPHVIVSVTKKLFASSPLDTDDKFSYTFKVAGTYEYYCSLHPHMTGKIVVK